MSLDDLKKPGPIINAGVLVAVIFSGSMVAGVPNRLTTVEGNQLLLMYRMEQLEKAVERSTRPVVDFKQQEELKDGSRKES